MQSEMLRQLLTDNPQMTVSISEKRLNGILSLCQGDFEDTIQIGVLAGWDCDCNPATAGGLIGIIEGFSNLPPDLTDPNICGDIYKNVHRPYLPDPNQPLPQYDTITNIAARLTNLAQQNILSNGGYITGIASRSKRIRVCLG